MDVQQKSMINLIENVGKEITLEGWISDIQQQHIIMDIRGKESLYLDMDDGTQIVIYVKGDINCLDKSRVTGTVIEVAGVHKDPRRKEIHTEYHIDVRYWECIQMSIEDMIDQLSGSELMHRMKWHVRKHIIKRGRTAISVLIDHMNDSRIYEKNRDIQNYMGLPPHEPPPPPLYADITVGNICVDMLYDIITPDYKSPYAKIFKPYSDSMFLIKDWKSWWEKNKEKSLEEIHNEMKPFVDKYWQGHGTIQVIP